MEVGAVDQGVDAAAEHGGQEHEVRYEGADLRHQKSTSSYNPCFDQRV